MPKILDFAKLKSELNRKKSTGPVDYLDLENKAHLNLILPHMKELPVLKLFTFLRHFYPNICLHEVLLLDTEAVYSMLELLRERIADNRTVN